MKPFFAGMLGVLLSVSPILGAEETNAPATEPSNAPEVATVSAAAEDTAGSTVRKVFVLPIREAIMSPLTYLVRRGVKEAMAADADVLILHMDTPGGSVAVTEEIIDIIGKFEGETITFVDSKAMSAGAFISASTQRIYMSSKGIIGAAAVIGMGGDLEPTVEAKAQSMVLAMIRTQAQKNGHDIDVLEAMIDMDKELIIDGETICEEGKLLSLTALEAEKEYGDPPKPLLSLGTYEDLDDLIEGLGYSSAERTEIQPLGAEKVASWLNAISGILLVIGIGGVWVEMKTPGFGLPGIVGIVAFTLFFFGSYAAGLAGMEWLVIFILGLVLIGLEIFILPGTIILGLSGVGLVLLTIVMAMADYYPGAPVDFSFLGQALENSLMILLQATGGTIVLMWFLYRWFFPRLAESSSTVGAMVSATASGVHEEVLLHEEQQSRLGQIGETTSPLRPGGKARFDDKIINVVSDAGMIDAGVRVKIIGASGHDAVVEPLEDSE